jgi:hypothetical protein
MMIKSIVVAVCICGSANGVFAKGNKSSDSGKPTADHTIKAHTNAGKEHAPAHATNPNNTKADNYSTKGNVNPYTGKPGTK